MVSILLLEQETPENHKLCIEALKRFTPEEHEIIALPPDEPFSASLQINLGLERSAKHSHKLIMSDSVIASEGWLGKLLDALNSDSRIGAIHCPTGESNRQSTPELTERSWILLWDSGITLIKDEMSAEIGLFDNRLFDIYYALNDYYTKIFLHGRFILKCPDLTQHHLKSIVGSNTTHINSKAAFKEIWGWLPEYSSSCNPASKNLVKRHPKAHIKVLDVGCACGGWLLYIKHAYPNAELYGIELNSSAAKISSTFANVTVGNVESGNAFNFPDGFFDVINCGDVLEHLVDPWALMKKLRKLLKPGGKLLISLPNVSHFSVVYNILQADFHYTDAGLLDRTHLRFFGAENAVSMATSSGFHVMSVSATVNLPRTPFEQDFLDKICAITDPQLHKFYTVYQFMMVCTPQMNSLATNR